MSLYLFLRTLTAGQQCPVQLPQDVPADSDCYVLRQKDLEKNQGIYRLKVSDLVPPFSLVDMSPAQLFGIIKTDPFIRSYGLLFLRGAGVNSGVFEKYVNQTAEIPISGLKDYVEIRTFFRTTPLEILGVSDILISLDNLLQTESFIRQRPSLLSVCLFVCCLLVSIS